MFFVLMFLFSKRFMLKGTQLKKWEESSLWLHRGLSCSKDENVMKINTNENVVNNNWFRKFEKFLGKRLWSGLQAYSVQTENLLEPYFTTYFFRNMFWKLVVFKKRSWRKTLWSTSVLIKLRPCSAQTVSLPKKEFSLCISEEGLVILMYLQESFLAWSIFLIKL